MYNNFFEWYDVEDREWRRKHPDDIMGPGISWNDYAFFLHKYLANNNCSTTSLESLKSVLRKHSKAYRKEHKNKPCEMHDNFYNLEKFDDFYATMKEHNVQFIDPNTYAQYCELYLLPKGYYTYAISVSQGNLEILIDLLEKFSLRYKIEKILYKSFIKL